MLKRDVICDKKSQVKSMNFLPFSYILLEAPTSQNDYFFGVWPLKSNRGYCTIEIEKTFLYLDKVSFCYRKIMLIALLAKF
ncbi:hypothetical protein BpHYR1_002908 [Brachionus plicatilis]|uniref:Uncharacterized protein n=1 Tax=Brachionus plicatilis TaxID=10195 RepID=A0A3M7PWJ4_BRAPC|nr:hypothetical protein BpHYR1_002908 [Brachionus plicatilis]